MRRLLLLSLCGPLLAQAAITHEETASNSGSIESSVELTVTMSGAASDGEVLIGICHRDDGTLGTKGQATGFPAGWTKASAISVSTEDQRDRVIDVGYKIASSEGTTYQFTNNGDNTEEMQCVILVYSDVRVSQLDVDPTASHYVFDTNSDAPDPPSITTLTDNAMILAIATTSGTTNTRSCTAPSGYTLRHGSSDPIDHAFICAAEKLKTPEGSDNPATFAIANGNDCGTTCSDDTYAATIAIKPAASGTNSVLFYTR